MRDRSVIGQIFFIKIIFFQKWGDRGDIELFGKTPVLRDRLTMLVIVERSAGKHCLRTDVGNGSRSQKVFVD